MAPIPRYRARSGESFLADFLSAGFRPFFLFAALWAAFALPLAIAYLEAAAAPPSRFDPPLWHAHEMVFGFGGAVVAGFLLTAIPNWTGRMPLQGAPLAGLVLLWLAGRAAVFFSADMPAGVAAALDLAFPFVFVLVVAREIVAGRNWRNLPMLAALTLLLVGNLLTHLEAMGVAATGALGARMGVATLSMLVALIGGRITPSFTRNWLVKTLPGAETPAPFDAVDRAALLSTLVALAAFVAAPEFRGTALLEIAAGVALFFRLARWRGAATGPEPLLFILHLGYGWLALGLLLMGANGLLGVAPPTAPLHALTVGAIGTMTLAVMTRATRGHTGRPLTADRRTVAIYVAITLAAVLRIAAPLIAPIAAPLAGGAYLSALWLAGALWSAAYGFFVLFYFDMLTGPRA
ncbi:NnrS family protein [Methylocystis sp. IM3]|uniref:NnrS family protein n=1 Tax=unclassified Methylocystis TaxID=2625913 RepID=UPI0030F715C0